MNVDEIRAVLDTAEAHAVHGEAVRIRQYLAGQHKVLNRQDFIFALSQAQIPPELTAYPGLLDRLRYCGYRRKAQEP